MHPSTNLTPGSPIRYWFLPTRRKRGGYGGYSNLWAAVPMTPADIDTLLWLCNHAEFRYRAGEKRPAQAKLSALRFFDSYVLDHAVDSNGKPDAELSSALKASNSGRIDSSNLLKKEVPGLYLGHLPFDPIREMPLSLRHALVDPRYSLNWTAHTAISFEGVGDYETGQCQSVLFSEQALLKATSDVAFSWSQGEDKSQFNAIFQTLYRYQKLEAYRLWSRLDESLRDALLEELPALKEEIHKWLDSMDPTEIAEYLPVLEGALFDRRLKDLILWSPVRAAAALARITDSPRRKVTEEHRRSLYKNCPHQSLPSVIPHLEGEHFAKAIDRLLEADPKRVATLLSTLEPSSEREVSAAQMARILESADAETRLQGMRILRHVPSAVANFSFPKISASVPKARSR